MLYFKKSKHVRIIESNVFTGVLIEVRYAYACFENFMLSENEMFLSRFLMHLISSKKTMTRRQLRVYTQMRKSKSRNVLLLRVFSY